MDDVKLIKKNNKSLPKVYKDNPDVGTVGIYELYTRLSFVCYLREKILNCCLLYTSPSPRDRTRYRMPYSA